MIARSSAVACVVLALLALSGSSASADAPVLAAEGFEWTYEVENVCSGGLIEVTDIGGDEITVDLAGMTWEGETLVRYSFEVSVPEDAS